MRCSKRYGMNSSVEVLVHQCSSEQTECYYCGDHRMCCPWWTATRLRFLVPPCWLLCHLAYLRLLSMFQLPGRF